MVFLPNIFCLPAAVVATACCAESRAKATGQARRATERDARASGRGAGTDCSATPIFAEVFDHAASRPSGFHARLPQIDPIQVWIDAERRLMGTQQKAAGLGSRSSVIFRDR
ncbi:hypothetical protein AOQ71_13750 [Bradyrhizobium manausense]|uniref:Uncharacterized protein n=2 Tax=Bradyrhizobium manausense TaxID=989370 RepID=A0A0R3DV99_9BRAD|nr:hypothetical protein AOQ71_13750 [Bradyrhizobium manausense]